MQRLAKCCLLAALTFASAGPATAAWIDYPGANLPIQSAGAAQIPSSIPDGSGGTLVAWYDTRVGKQIYAQHVLASGDLDPAWPNAGLRVSSPGEIASTAPLIESDGNGGAIIAFIHQAPDLSGSLRVQHVLASGVVDPQWPTGGQVVRTTPGSSQVDARILADGSGGALVAFSEVRGGNNVDVFAHHIQATGELDPSWPVDGLPVCTEPHAQVGVRMVTDLAGGFVVSWQDFRDPTSYNLYAHHVLSSGTLDSRWPINGVQVSPGSGSLGLSAVVVTDQAGGAIWIWRDIPPGGGEALFAQHLLVDGTPAPGWQSARPIISPGNAEGYPAAIPDGAGGAIVTWAHYLGFQGFGYATFALHLTSQGVADPTWQRDGVQCSPEWTSYASPTLVSDSSGGALIVWADGRRPNSYLEYYAAHLLSRGTLDPSWPAGGSALTQPVAEARNKSDLAISSDGHGGAVACWTDSRQGPMAIYGQLIMSNGHLGASPSARIREAVDTPNDQGGKIKLSWSASVLDGAPYGAIADYRVWRSVPPNLIAPGARSVTSTDDDLSPATSTSGLYRTTRTAAGTIYWEYVSTQPARAFDGYSLVVATTSDSTPESNPKTLFMVEARCIDGSLFWDSPVDSGYSVDNLAPPTPAPFTGNFMTTSVGLHWTPSTARDFSEFRLYRGATRDFLPSPGNEILATRDTGYVDARPSGGFYKLAALDLHGNRSHYALVSPTNSTATLASLVSSEWTGTTASLMWFGDALAKAPVNLYRAQDDAPWALVSQLSGDGSGYVRYEDADILAGHRYAYRLGVLDAGVERFTGEAHIQIPAGRLALSGILSNPVRQGTLSFVATFASAVPASARVIDLAGRVISEQAVMPNLAGPVSLDLPSRTTMRPGIYLLEVQQGTQRAVGRFVLLR